MKAYLKKHKTTIVLMVIAILLFVPQTGTPIKVFLNRLLSGSPSLIAEKNQERLTDYNWSLFSLANEKVNLEQSKGRVVLVNLWATWCPPCLAELPSLEGLYNQYANRMDFYFISYEDATVLKRFLAKKDVSLPVYNPASQSPTQLESSALPTTFLISKEGIIVMKKTGAARWDSEKTKQVIEKLLAE
ncbi:MAG TPA: TlpA disulfide reductase family protein [Flavobacteriaceae bacterium]|nr:TlpA family protein disulfide reductase [Flavobacteriaceae bacterium]MCB9212566.1 TlpA family protein disulfide reductase [Alteromonas sp.]HPF10634.1 TlpA disulfide reductase family protein [Flavobacteriaceae bacterium]HQU20916.1 TlpA disulfide reductase family protein [Flavobacteriaceae bacterium]HQU64400.1 TlpA disulfide reductase family protein [Flavobacteriaceae bacterium]